MRVAQFYLKLTAEEFLEYYQRKKQYVRVRTYQGYSIQFKAEHLRPSITRNGIDGVFEITFDQHNRFVSLIQVQSYLHSSSAGSAITSQENPPSSRSYSSNQRPRKGFNKSI